MKVGNFQVNGADHDAVFEANGDDPVDHKGQALTAGAADFDLLVVEVADLRDHFFDDRFKYLFLAFEEIIKGGFVDADVFGNIVHGCGRIAVQGKAFFGGFDDLGAAVFFHDNVMLFTYRLVGST